MTTYTSTYALPSPGLADAPNAPAQFAALTAATETALNTVRDATGVNNLLINSRFEVDQRAASPATVTGASTGWISDRWKCTSGTGATNVLTRTAISTGSFAGAPRYKMAWNRSVAGSSTSYIHQRIEDVRNGAGKSVTVAFNAAVSSGTSDITVSLTQCFGTGGSPSSDVTTVGATTITVTTSTSTRHTVTISCPSISGKTIGSNEDSYLEVRINRASATGTGTVDLWDPQCVIGSTAPTYVARNPQQELALCQRYYYQFGPFGGSRYTSVGWCYSTTVLYAVFKFPVSMRTSPAVTFSATNDFTATNSSAAYNSTNVTGSHVTPDQCLITCTVASGLTAGQAAMFSNDQDTTNAAIYATAEL